MNSGGLVKADRAIWGHFVPFFRSTARPVVHPGLLFFRGSFGAIVEFVFRGLGFYLEMLQSLRRQGQGGGLNLLGRHRMFCS